MGILSENPFPNVMRPRNDEAQIFTTIRTKFVSSPTAVAADCFGAWVAAEFPGMTTMHYNAASNPPHRPFNAQPAHWRGWCPITDRTLYIWIDSDKTTEVMYRPAAVGEVN